MVDENIARKKFVTLRAIEEETRKMPRRSRGPRLWFNRPKKSSRKIIEHAVSVIRDGSCKRSTGCGPREIGKAEGKLRDYLRVSQERVGNRDPSAVVIADVVAIYSEDVAARAGDHSRINLATSGLSYLNKATCAAYAKTPRRGHRASRTRWPFARLFGIIWGLGLCTALTPIVLPDRVKGGFDGLPAKKRPISADGAPHASEAIRENDRPRDRPAGRCLMGIYTGTCSRSGVDAHQDELGHVLTCYAIGLFAELLLAHTARRPQKNGPLLFG